MKRAQVERWVEAYLRAWNQNEGALIGGLFSARAVYSTGPFDRPWKGRAAIVKNWLARKDEPGSFRFRFEVLACDGDLAVVRGWTSYLNPPREFSNLWVIRFDSDGLCKEFAEWWIQRT